MTKKTLQSITAITVENAKNADIVALAEKYAVMRKESTHEYSGPCPKCGGTDRFHVNEAEGWFFCRSCHEKLGDTIEFVRWMDGLSFVEAVRQLTGESGDTEVCRVKRQPVRNVPAKQSDEWKEKAERIVAKSQACLRSQYGEPGREYLQGRGIEQYVWEAFGFGYDPDVAVPGTEGKKRAPAIVMPWISTSGVLYAVRYRFLESQNGHRLTAMAGSKFEGRLYGGHVLATEGYRLKADGEASVLSLRTLLIVEGELNAASCYQEAHEAKLDVLSVGSESATLPQAAVDFAGLYGRVLVWMDRPEVAKRMAWALPNSHGIRSPFRRDDEGIVVLNGDGKPKKVDANDMLQEGLLGGFIGSVRARAIGDGAGLESLLWDMYDAAMTQRGVDAGTAEIVSGLAVKLGRKALLVERKDGRWITATQQSDDEVTLW